jgi:uncharacterized protein YjbJ (UPF0337 family)
MKNLIDGLTSLMKTAPALELSIPDASPGQRLRISMVFTSEKMDAKLKTAEGRLQSASGDLTGNLGDKVKGDSKQVQGSVMDTLAELHKARQEGHKDS